MRNKLSIVSTALISLTAIVLTACTDGGPLPLSGSRPSATAVSQQPPTTGGGSQQPPDGRRPAPVYGSTWTPAQKCDWLRANFPQTTADVQALGAKLANVQTARIRTHAFPCDLKTTVFDGFIVLGPNEGYHGAVTMTVPKNGAIDSYHGATFSGTNMEISPPEPRGTDTVRGFDGTVTGVSMTFWPWLDENPPSGQTAAPAPQGSNEPASVSCIQPTKLASDNGWADKGWADQKYGGLRVELTKAGSLPAKWEAQASGRRINEDDQAREMVAGFWTVYPPHACRTELGYSS